MGEYPAIVLVSVLIPWVWQNVHGGKYLSRERPTSSWRSSDAYVDGWRMNC